MKHETKREKERKQKKNVKNVRVGKVWRRKYETRKVLNEKELSKLFKVCENFYTKNSNEEKHTHPHSQEDC